MPPVTAPDLVDLDCYYLSYASPYLPACYQHLEIHINPTHRHDGGWYMNVGEQNVTFATAQGVVLCTVSVR